MKKVNQIISLIVFSTFMSCNSENQKVELQTGDILFREAVFGKLSKAIDEVTQTDSATHFSHVGLVELVEGESTVLHASTESGTCRVSLDKFSNPDGDPARVVIYRLKPEFHRSIPAAIQKARSMLGKPYNLSYILSDSAHYCSEFVYKAFEEDSVFEMNPMTFKDPMTGEFQKTWVDYYQNIGIEIPEGMPGCNPNGMAASEKLIKLGELK